MQAERPKFSFTFDFYAESKFLKKSLFETSSQKLIFLIPIAL